MKGKPILGIVAILGVAVVGAVYFFDSKNSGAVVTTESVATTTTTSTTTTISTAAVTQDEYDDYIEQGVEEFVKEELGITGTASLEKPTAENTNSETDFWVLVLPLNSLNDGLFLTEDNGGTPWMDHVRFDKGLTDFEVNEQAQLAQQTATWQLIINDPDLSSQFMTRMQNEYRPIWQDKLDYLKGIQSTVVAVSPIFQSRFGIGSQNIPAKYLALYQWNLDVVFVTTDLITLVETNLNVKDRTVAAVQDKDVNAAVTAANDEDRIDLVGSWYEERLGELFQETKEMQALLRQLIEEYPSQ